MILKSFCFSKGCPYIHKKSYVGKLGQYEQEYICNKCGMDIRKLSVCPMGK